MKLPNIVWHKRNILLLFLSVGLFGCGVLFLYLSSLQIPDLGDLSGRKVAESTKIYDRTGNILLYDMSQDTRRTIIPFEDISNYIKEATLAIEDKNFYSHGGIEPSAILRAVLVNLATLSFSQGGSTITQQVVKNTILTNDKTPTRKLKEWILSIKLEKVLTKDQIFNLYLNEIPYGGNVYGIEEAAQTFFGKKATDLTLPESAYLAALTRAPTYYSPYGTHKDLLEQRKNLVLNEMATNGFISATERDKALKTKVEFKPKENTGGLKAPHFVFFVIDYLAKKYGEDVLDSGGLKITTTLDYDIQSKAEAVAKQYGETNQKQFNADNNAMVVIDPKTGDILAMVGSRDYFDTTISGNFNAATAHRQPGSTFKPFVYSTLFNKGYTPETTLMDAPIQFTPTCKPDDLVTHDDCYAPGNYDDAYRGPMSVRSALSQSINIPAVEALYLAGVKNSIDLAHNMGIEGLADENRYGLSLVLGGGEVSLLDMTSAYSVFGNDGVRNPYRAVLQVEDKTGTILEENMPDPKRVLDAETARKISSILSDNVARTPAYGSNSPLYISDRDMAVKTGTTNDYKDAWILGYSPDIAVGAWVGNNDNTPMEKKVAGFIVAPMWRAFMDKILPSIGSDSFVPPETEDLTSLKPVLSGNLPQEIVNGTYHSILYWVDKDNPRGPIPTHPDDDPQFKNWEYGVLQWNATQGQNLPKVFN